jgi:hypothetical protein
MAAVSQISNYSSTNPLPTSVFNFQTRQEELLQKIRIFENKLGMSHPVKMAIGNFDIMPQAHLLKNTIEIPPWLLFKTEDIPPQFCVANLDDPRLTDPNFLNEMADWMNGKIKESGLSSLCDPADTKTLQRVIRLMSDRDGYEKAKDFILGHGTAHLSQDLKTTVILHAIIGYAPLAAIILCLVLAAVSLPFVNIAFILGLGIAVSTASFASAYFLQTKIVNPFWIEEGKKADSDTVRALQDARGGIYLLDTLRHHNKKRRTELAASLGTVGANGSLVLANPKGGIRGWCDYHKNLMSYLGINDNGDDYDPRHLPLTERVTQLRKWQSKHPQISNLS